MGKLLPSLVFVHLFVVIHPSKACLFSEWQDGSSDLFLSWTADLDQYSARTPSCTSFSHHRLRRMLNRAASTASLLHKPLTSTERHCPRSAVSFMYCATKPQEPRRTNMPDGLGNCDDMPNDMSADFRRFTISQRQCHWACHRSFLAILYVGRLRLFFVVNCGLRAYEERWSV